MRRRRKETLRMRIERKLGKNLAQKKKGDCVHALGVDIRIRHVQKKKEDSAQCACAMSA
jgi:hypothetical protein